MPVRDDLSILLVVLRQRVQVIAPRKSIAQQGSVIGETYIHRIPNEIENTRAGQRAMDDACDHPVPRQLVDVERRTVGTPLGLSEIAATQFGKVEAAEPFQHMMIESDPMVARPSELQAELIELTGRCDL